MIVYVLSADSGRYTDTRDTSLDVSHSGMQSAAETRRCYRLATLTNHSISLHHTDTVCLSSSSSSSGGGGGAVVCKGRLQPAASLLHVLHAVCTSMHGGVCERMTTIQ